MRLAHGMSRRSDGMPMRRAPSNRVYMTDFGLVPMPKDFARQSGARFFRNGRYKNGNAFLLHHFLTRYTFDCFMECVTP